jgi:KTSC domain-containing protein
MAAEPVQPKGIRVVAYDAERRTLDVEFAPAKIYRYFDVPPDVHAWLARVESKGKFINRLVRDKYRYERLDGDACAAPGGDDGLLAALQKSLETPP